MQKGILTCWVSYMKVTLKFLAPNVYTILKEVVKRSYGICAIY